jgi:hypothetical protein
MQLYLSKLINLVSRHSLEFASATTTKQIACRESQKVWRMRSC